MKIQFCVGRSSWVERRTLQLISCIPGSIEWSKFKTMHRALVLGFCASLAFSPSMAQQAQRPRPPQNAPSAVPSSPAATLAPAAPAQAPQAPAQGAQTAKETPESGGLQKIDTASPAWTAGCVSHSRAALADCTLEQRLISRETRQVLSAVVISVPGVTRQPTLFLQLPNGLALQEPLTIRIDDTQSWPVPFQSCDNRGCTASLPITPQLLAAMRAGRMMTITAFAANREVLNFPHMLTDFVASYEAVQ